MNLDEFLRSKGACGTRCRMALIGHLRTYFRYGEPAKLTHMEEKSASNYAEQYFKTGKCGIRGLGHKGLLLLAEYFRLKTERPKKAKNLNIPTVESYFGLPPGSFKKFCEENASKLP